MVRTSMKIFVSFLIALGLLMPGANNRADAKTKKKVGFFTRLARHVKRDVKRNIKKTRRAIVKTGCKVQDKVMDGAIKAKSALTGKKARKTHVLGHYKKGNKKHTSGHFRRVKRSHKHSGGSSSGNQAPTTPPAVGNPLPPVDPALPTTTMMKSKGRK